MVFPHTCLFSVLVVHFTELVCRLWCKFVLETSADLYQATSPRALQRISKHRYFITHDCTTLVIHY